MVTYANLTALLANMHIDSGYLVVVTKEGSENRFFKCMESMARDMRHPYIPSTTVLGDILLEAQEPNRFG